MKLIEPLDFDNFIFIGSKIDDKIYEIPEDDLKWFKEKKKQILQGQAIVERLEKRISELETDELFPVELRDIILGNLEKIFKGDKK